jgi:3-hydroxyisobutyrate dehydrogenase
VPGSPANNGYKPGFATNLMLKDAKLSQAAAQSTGVVTPLGDEAVRLYSEFADAGGADRDFSGIITFLRDKTRNA